MDLFLYVITKPVSVHIWFSEKKSQNFQKLLREYHWFALWMFPSWEVSNNFFQPSFSVNLLKVKCKCCLVGHFWIAVIISKTRTKKTKLTVFQEDVGSLLHHYLWKSNISFKISLLNMPLKINWGNWIKEPLRFIPWPKIESKQMFTWTN